MPIPISNDPVHLREFLERGVFLRDGEGNIDLNDSDPVHIAVVMSVKGYGPHEAAIFVDQNRYHASADSALEGAYEILEQYWWDHYKDHYDELVKDYGQEEVDDYGMFTETFNAVIWELTPEEAAAAIEGTDAAKFIDVDELEEAEDEAEITGAFSRLTISASRRKKDKFKVGDEVVITTQGLQEHSRSTPSSWGYSRETINWRRSLSERKNEVAVVARVYPNSDNVDIEYPDGYYILVHDYMLTKV